MPTPKARVGSSVEMRPAGVLPLATAAGPAVAPGREAAVAANRLGARRRLPMLHKTVTLPMTTLKTTGPSPVWLEVVAAD